MSNINIVDLRAKNAIERKLERMKELKAIEKAVIAEFEMLKKELITEYFNLYESYENANGQTLATYKASEPVRFQQTEFKADHPDIFEAYTQKTLQYTFRLL